MYIVSCDMMCSQWNPLTNLGINHIYVNIPGVGHTRLDTDLPFCHLCMTAMHEYKWLVVTKKAGLSLTQPSSTVFYQQKGSNHHFQEVHISVANAIRKQTKPYNLHPA